MEMSTTVQRKQLIRLLKYDEVAKKAAVEGVTMGRTDSLRQLTKKEADFLMGRLQGKPTPALWSYFNKDNSQHRHILSLCIQYGWSIKSERHGEVADLMKLHEWLKEHPKCPVRKPLKQMDKSELSKIILAFEGMINWKFK